MSVEFYHLTKEEKQLLNSIIKTYKKYDLDLEKAFDEVQETFLEDCSPHEADIINKLVKYDYLTDSGTIFPTETGLHYDYFHRLNLQDKYLRPVVVSIITSLLTTAVALLLKGLL